MQLVLDEIMVVVLHDLNSGFIRSVRKRKVNLSPPCVNIASSWQSPSQKEGPQRQQNLLTP